jgi:hypothetical protein
VLTKIQVYLCTFGSNGEDLHVTTVVLEQPSTVSATATAATTSASAESFQDHIDLSQLVPQCIGVGAPREGGLLIFTRVSGLINMFV